MAEQPYASFADYLKRSQSRPAPAMPKVDLSKLKTSAGSSKKSDIPQDPLSWLVDIISRPLYGVTESIDSVLEAPEDSKRIREKFSSGDFMGGVGESIAATAKMGTAPFRGVFSTHEDDKRLTSDLIEKGTDVAGREFDPNYKDTDDNVNPVLKGILGFVGDVGLDPLTYVPGAAIASIGKGIGKGAKAVGAGAKSATEALKASRTPAEEVIEATGVRVTPEATVADNVDIPKSTVDDTPVANPRAEFTDGPYEVILHNRSSSRVEKFATKEEAEAFTEMLRKEKGWKETKSGNTRQVGKYQIVAPKPAASATEAIVSKAPASLGEAMRSSEKFGEAKGFLDELSKAPAKAPKAKAPEVEVEYPDLPSWTKGMIEHRPTKVVATRGTEDLTMVDAMRIIGDDLEDYALRKSVRDQVEVEYELAKKAFTEKAIKEAKAKGKKLPAKKSKQEDLSTQRARFRSIVSTEEGIAQVEKVLGSGLAGYLKNPNLSDARFEATIDKLRSMLDDTGTLDDFDLETRGSPFNKLLKQLGIGTPPTVQRTHIEYRRAQSKVGQVTPQSMIDSIRQVSDEVELDDLTRQGREDVAAVLPGILERNLRDVGPEHGYKYISDSGALRTDDIAGFGLGRFQYQVNTHVQMEMITKLLQRITKRVDDPAIMGRKMAGPQRAKEIEKQLRAGYGEMVRLLDDYGVPVHLDEVFPDRQPVQLPLNFNEVYDTLAATSPEAHAVLQMLLFNMKTSMPHSRLMEATARLLADEDFVAPLVATGSRYNSEAEISNFLAGEEKWGTYGHRAIAQNQRNVKNYEPPAGARYVPNKNKKGLFIEYSNTYAREVLTEALRAAKPELLELAAKNKAIYDQRYGEEVFDMTDVVFNRLLALIEDPTKIDEALSAAAAPGKLVVEAARSGQVLPQSAATAGAIVEAETATLMGKAKTAVKVADGATGGGKKGASKGTPEGRKAQQEQFKAAQAENVATETAVKATQGADEVPVETLDVSMKWTGDIQGQIIGIMDPLGKVFRASHGMTAEGMDLYRLKHVSGVLHKTLMGMKIKGLRELNQKYGNPIPGMNQTPLVAAFHALQKSYSDVPVGNQMVTEAYTELRKYMGDLMGPGGVLGNTFFRNNVGIEYINDIFGQYDILGKGKTGPKGTFFDLDEAAKEVAAAKALSNEVDLLTAAETQWRSWDVTDPIDFISKLNTAAIRMATDVGVAQSFQRMAIKEGLGSLTPQPGMVKLTASGKSRLVRLLDDDFYVDKEVAHAFHRMDEVMGASQSIEGEIGKFIHNVFDPTQNAWKVAITIYRPGHHIRNFFGDESMTYFAEGTKGWNKAARDAFKVMSLRNQYEGVDIIRSLNHLDIHELPKGGDVISSGKYGDITNEGIIAAAMREGLLPPAYVVEDVYIDDELGAATNALKKVMATVTFKGKAPEKIASGVSEYRDHYSRLKHFIQFIDKAQKSGQYKNLEEMMAAAGKQVKKWHPDVSLLSTTEAKYMRRLLPFYSWFRGAVPAIGSAVVMNPARVNMFNKASYNLAVSMGVNPESLSDPFPEDQLFPSFLTEQMEGPQFKMPDGTYMRVNPGFASWDVFNMLGGADNVPEGVIRGVAGATSPLIRMPAEMLSGGSWGTGARINDMSDYLDSAIPGVNYLSNITGTSVTGTLANLSPDPQFQHAKGNKGPADQALSFLNYLSGIGLQDYSKPNYINFAEIEKRNREGEQRGF